MCLFGCKGLHRQQLDLRRMCCVFSALVVQDLDQLDAGRYIDTRLIATRMYNIDQYCIRHVFLLNFIYLGNLVAGALVLPQFAPGNYFDFGLRY